MVQSLVRDFVHDQLKPLERDVLGRAAGLKDARAYLPPETEDRLMKMATDIGLWGLGVPEDLGGMGLGTLGNCLAEEEIAQTIVPFSFGDVTPILFECNAEQKERYFLPHFSRKTEPVSPTCERGPSRQTATLSSVGGRCHSPGPARTTSASSLPLPATRA